MITEKTRTSHEEQFHRPEGLVPKPAIFFFLLIIILVLILSFVLLFLFLFLFFLVL